MRYMKWFVKYWGDIVPTLLNWATVRLIPYRHPQIDDGQKSAPLIGRKMTNHTEHVSLNLAGSAYMKYQVQKFSHALIKIS